jgi:hypothetical protein
VARGDDEVPAADVGIERVAEEVGAAVEQQLRVRVAVGGDNVFDVYPDREKDGTLQFLGQEYAITSPFGFNGASWYVRFSADF